MGTHRARTFLIETATANPGPRKNRTYLHVAVFAAKVVFAAGESKKPCACYCHAV
jgi:hypothetical protein